MENVVNVEFDVAAQYTFLQKSDVLLHILSRTIFISMLFQELHGRVHRHKFLHTLYMYELQLSDGAVHSSYVSESSSDNGDLAG
jgi:hypothetical protein